MRFKIDSQTLELLVAMDECHSLEELARHMGKDVSVISRSLTRLGTPSGLIEKVRGRWRLTALGKNMVSWARGAISAQAALLGEPRRLKIATTREFSARVLASALPEFEKAGYRVSVITPVGGIEAALLSGNADIALACAVPESPEIRYERVIPEKMFAVNRDPIRTSDLSKLPYLHYEPLELDAVESVLKFELKPRFVIDDLASLRTLVLQGEGWAWMPAYTVKDEIEAGTLHGVTLRGVEQLYFGVYVERGRAAGLAEETAFAKKWLSRQSLG